MPEKEFTPEYIFLEEIQTRVLEINNYLKILNAVLTQEDEMYYLQVFMSKYFLIVSFKSSTVTLSRSPRYCSTSFKSSQTVI